MSEALAAVFEWTNDLDEATADPAETLGVLAKIDSVLAILNGRDAADVADDADALARDIDAKRAAKDFAAADAIRADLLGRGYKVLTTKDGTKVEKPLA